MRSLVFVAALCAASPSDAGLALTPLAGSLPLIVGIEHAGDQSGRLFLVSQRGRILVFDGAGVLPSPFLDISALVRFGSEQGLLGLAFHPGYAANGYFYVNYTDTAGDTVVARYRVSADPDIADPASAAIVLTQDQPFANHNGGQIRFGPDGFLYIAFGDGGSDGDSQDNAQNLGTLLGSILRIDVDAAPPYAIPPSNPFVSTPGARGEIWSYGLRNPWRFTFDRLTGDMFVADVGQGSWEEVNVQPAAAGGRNYGWRRMEGTHCFTPAADCTDGTLALPAIEYPHSIGCSITGGFRYRGSAMPGFAGTYFFSDYCAGRIWGATTDGQTWRAVDLLDAGFIVSTFGEDEAGELYVARYAEDGGLYRLAAGDSAAVRLAVSRVGNGHGVVTSTPARIYCAQICGVDAPAGASFALAVVPDAGSSFLGWSGHEDCADGMVTLASARHCYARLVAPFTDPLIVSGATPIRAVHVTELRARVDALRVAAGLAEVSWTDPVLVPGSTPVRAAHLRELRDALDEAYDALGQPRPGYSGPDPDAGVTIRASHIVELRAALTAIE